MKKALAALLASFVGLFGYKIVDKALETRVENLEFQVSSQQEEIESLHNIGKYSVTSVTLPWSFSDLSTTATPPPTQSEPTQSEPTQSQPTQSQPTQSQPTQSQPTQSQPTQSQPTQSITFNEEPYVEFSGYCGDNAQWQLLSNGELLIKGSGEIYSKPSFSEDKYRYKVKKATVGEGITKLGDYCFNNCPYLRDIHLPNTLIEIGNYGCACLALENINMPSSISSIGYCAFQNCRNLTSIIIPDKVSSLGFYTFVNCVSLTNIILGETLTEIGNHCFDGCILLDNVVIPDSLTSIGEYAFYNCENLRTLVIGKGVSEIKSYAFAGCYNLTSVSYHGTEADWNKINFNENNAMLTSRNIEFA